MNVTKQDKHHSNYTLSNANAPMSLLCPEKLVWASNLLANFEIYNVHGYIMLQILSLWAFIPAPSACFRKRHVCNMDVRCIYHGIHLI